MISLLKYNATLHPFVMMVVWVMLMMKGRMMVTVMVPSTAYMYINDRWWTKVTMMVTVVVTMVSMVVTMVSMMMSVVVMASKEMMAFHLCVMVSFQNDVTETRAVSIEGKGEFEGVSL